MDSHLGEDKMDWMDIEGNLELDLPLEMRRLKDSPMLAPGGIWESKYMQSYPVSRETFQDLNSEIIVILLLHQNSTMNEIKGSYALG